jgi:hypothetical protein
MSKKIKFLIGFVIVLALTLFLVAQVSAAPKAGGQEIWEEWPSGDWTYEVYLKSGSPPPIVYDCEEYVTVMGCNNGYPGYECVSGFTVDTRELGVGCGMVVHYLDQTYWPDYTLWMEIDFETTVCHHGVPGIAGWRTGMTTGGNMVLRGYMGDYDWSKPYFPYMARINWSSRIVAPWRVDFRYDPNSPTCVEAGWCSP